jgi:hypothetical protein
MNDLGSLEYQNMAHVIGPLYSALNNISIALTNYQLGAGPHETTKPEIILRFEAINTNIHFLMDKLS